MTTIQTLTDFLRSTDATFRLFDMGRRISKLPSEQFQQFERAERPYPLPLAMQAWIGIMIWNPKKPQEHLFWFLKFPLDEQGLLVQAARDDFLNRLAKSVGSQLLNQGEEQDPLKDNPFSFTPDQEKMAAFHARASRILQRSPSAYYEPAREYFRGLHGYQAWQDLGLQGVADITARLDQQGNEQLLAAAIPQLPLEPLQAVCAHLEHETPSQTISAALQARLEQELSSPQANPYSLGALLRALSLSHADEPRQEAIRKVLNSTSGAEIEILAAIASRCWTDLREASVRHLFMQQLAVNSAGQQSFNLMIRDLLFIPGMRPVIMESFRDPQRSDELGRAIGAFLHNH